MNEKFACVVCKSEGFEPSSTGKGCTFCDGTEGGNPPLVGLDTQPELALLLKNKDHVVINGIECYIEDAAGFRPDGIIVFTKDSNRAGYNARMARYYRDNDHLADPCGSEPPYHRYIRHARVPDPDPSFAGCGGRAIFTRVELRDALINRTINIA